MPIRDIDQERATAAMLGENPRLAAAYADLQRLHEQIDDAMGWIHRGLHTIKSSVEDPWKPGETLENGYVIEKPRQSPHHLGPSVLELPALIAKLNATRELIAMLEKNAKETK